MKKRNEIDSIIEGHHKKLTNKDYIALAFTFFFYDIFSTFDPSRIEEVDVVVYGCINDDM